MEEGVRTSRRPLSPAAWRSPGSRYACWERPAGDDDDSGGQAAPGSSKRMILGTESCVGAVC